MFVLKIFTLFDLIDCVFTLQYSFPLPPFHQGAVNGSAPGRFFRSDRRPYGQYIFLKKSNDLK